MNYTTKTLCMRERIKVEIIPDICCYNSGHSEQSVVILSLVIQLFSLNQIDAILPRKLAKRYKSIMKVQRHLTLVTVFSEGHNK